MFIMTIPSVVVVFLIELSLQMRRYPKPSLLGLGPTYIIVQSLGLGVMLLPRFEF